MATQREYLVSLGLAKPSRGRFSKEAKAALAKAVEEGMTFTDTKEAPQASADASEHPRPRPSGEASPSPRKDSGGGVPLLIIGGSPTKLRNISSLKGLTVEGYRVGFDTCRRCMGPLTHCSCKKPKAPGIVVEILDLPDWTPVG